MDVTGPLSSYPEGGRCCSYDFFPKTLNYLSSLEDFALSFKSANSSKILKQNFGGLRFQALFFALQKSDEQDDTNYSKNLKTYGLVFFFLCRD
jgi:hypothetical protein